MLKERIGRGMWFTALLLAANIGLAIATTQGASAFTEKFCSGSGAGGECLPNGDLEACTHGSQCRHL